MHRSRSAFSLLELAVVLAIVGLLVGGVMGGIALVKNSVVKSAMLDATAYRAAITQFNQLYGNVPGDMINATKYWGAATCPNGAGTGTQTCNGNGSRIIEPWDEMYRSWQHLSASGLIRGTFPGTYTLVSSRGVGVPDVNIPSSKYAGSGWSMIGLTTNSATNFEFGYTDGSARRVNMLVLGAASTTEWANAVLVPVEEAFEIDKKMDDGRPAFGAVYGGGCVTTTLSTTAEYAISTTNRCRLGFQFQ